MQQSAVYKGVSCQMVLADPFFLGEQLHCPHSGQATLYFILVPSEWPKH